MHKNQCIAEKDISNEESIVTVIDEKDISSEEPICEC